MAMSFFTWPLGRVDAWRQLRTGLRLRLVQSLEQARFPAGRIPLVYYALLGRSIQRRRGQLGGLSGLVPLSLTDERVRSLDVGSSSGPVDSVTQPPLFPLSQPLLGRRGDWQSFYSFQLVCSSINHTPF